jgi:hypothetical protein
MLVRKRQAYVLAIHGCPIWPTLGLGSDLTTVLTAKFAAHIGDGGTGIDTLSAPSISQVLDPTGGFARVSDASFEFIDGRDDRFAQFFAANRVGSVHTYLTEDFDYLDTSMVVNDTSNLADGDILYLPRETVDIGAVDTETEMAINTRSLFSAFTEGRWPTYNAVNPKLGRGPDVALGGHWNHAGRWVCLYRLQTDEYGELGAPVRLYAGVIDEVTFDGRRVSVSTRSITSLLGAPILQEGQFTMAPGAWYCPVDMYLYNRFISGNEMAKLTGGLTYTTIFSALEDDANDRSSTMGNDFIHTMKPTHCEVQAGGATLPDPAIDAPVLDLSHPALVEYLALTADPYLEGPSRLICSMPPWDEAKYDFIILPAGKFNFSESVYGVSPYDQPQLFLFDNGTRKVVIPCTFEGTYWQFAPLDPWQDIDGNILPDEQRYLCWNTGTGKILGILAFEDGAVTDLPFLLYQVLTTTGAGLNPLEGTDVRWWQSIGLPYYLVDFTTFMPIWYTIVPNVFEQKTLLELFESSLKIAGYSLVWGAAGQLKFKQNPIAAEGYHTGHYTLAQVAARKPSTTLGYPAPLTSISVKSRRLNQTWNFVMPNPQSNFTKSNQLVLEDDLMSQEYEHIGPVAYQSLYWLSNTIPSTPIRVSEVIGEVGDIVLVCNEYLPDASGYGVTDRTALQTEVTLGPEETVRLLLAGNVNLSDFCMLCPAGGRDEAVGSHGLDAGALHFTTEHDQGSNFTTWLFGQLGTTGPFDIMVRSVLSHVVIEGCYLNLVDNTIEVPALWTWPSGFASMLTESYRYVTFPDYYRAEEH